MVLALCLVHWTQRRKSQGVTIAEAQELWNIKGYAPVTGKIGFLQNMLQFLLGRRNVAKMYGNW